MSNDGVVQVRQYRGTYGKKHRPRGLNVEVGTVTVRSGTPETRLPIGSRGVRAKKEVSFPEWKEYAVPRHGTLRRKEVSEMLDVVRRRKNTFHRHMVERFATAVRKHFDQHGIAQCPVTVVAKGRYPLNPEVGTFYRLKVPGSDELFPIPKEFLPQDERAKAKHT